MNAKIKTLANQMKALREEGKKFVPMLGAGASLSSGVKPTNLLMEELLTTYGSHVSGGDTLERFSELWRTAANDMRELYLRPYLDKTPSQGYRQLAELMKDGYFDQVITFNFDRLLQTALSDLGLREGDDFLTIVRGDFNDSVVEEMMQRSKPRIKILKLHGSLVGSTFLFSDDEMLNYPEPINNLVKTLTQNYMIVCGYGFEDMCVVRAFSPEGGSIYCVNPGGKPKYLRGFITRRNSEGYVIDNADGKFDEFMAQLYTTLRPQPAAPPSRPKTNPFKFLGSLNIEDRDWLSGRNSELTEILRMMSPQKAVIVMGPGKAGKTSLIRAGLIAGLDPAKFQPFYVRCCGDIARSLNTQLRTPLNLPKDASIESVLDSLAKSTTKQIVLILDQFERVVNQHPSTQEADRFVGNLRSLFQSQHDNLNVICVSSVSANEGGRLLFSMMQVKNFWEGPLNVGDLAPDLVREFIIGWTAKAEITFETALIERLLADYGKSLESDRTFSLAHVQAVCNIMCRKGDLSLAGYLDVLETERAVLDLTINHCDFINFIEDVPSQERALLRNIVRTISHTECNQRIVDYVRDYVAELLDGDAPRASSQLIN